MNYYIGKDVDLKVLNHYGVIGMKWGVRRFQNKDGSLTEAGKERYVSRSTAKYEKKAEKARAKGDEKAYKKWEKRATNSRELDRYEEEMYKKAVGGKNFVGKLLVNRGTLIGDNAYRRDLAVTRANKNGGKITTGDKVDAFVSRLFTGGLGSVIASKLYEYTNDPSVDWDKLLKED